MTDELPDAGPELDRLVAEALNGAVTYFDDPSTNSGDALFALEAWREQHPDWTGYINLSSPEFADYTVQLWHVPQAVELYSVAQAPTLAVAICHAIVLAGRAVQG